MGRPASEQPAERLAGIGGGDQFGVDGDGVLLLRGGLGPLDIVYVSSK